MYFETIHDLSDFEEVHGPSEDGYSSCWETETEFDSELGNFIFHNVTGDSASVICIDEAMDLLAMREQQQQMQLQIEEARRRKAVCENVGAELGKLGPGDLEYTFDQQQADDKRSGGASRHSHHSGSDGTYDGPQQAPIHHHTTIVATPLPDEPVECKEDHIYETLDACQDHHFQMYVGKGSTGSQSANLRYSAATTSTSPPKVPPGHGSDNDSDKSAGRRHPPVKSPSFKSLFGVKSRTCQQSVEQQQQSGVAVAPPKREKLNLKKKNSLDSNVRGAQVAPKHYPGPLKGYGLDKPHHLYKRSSQEKIINSSSSNSPASSQNSVPPSLVIKHKGKTYIIPVVERKKEGKAKQQSSSGSKRVHNVLCTNAQNSSHPPMNTFAPHPPSVAQCTPFVVNGGAVGTPKKLVASAQAPNVVEHHHDGGPRRRKGSQPNSVSVAPSSKHSAAVPASNRVTHYGML